MRRLLALILTVAAVAALAACDFEEKFADPTESAARWHENRWFTNTCALGAMNAENAIYLNGQVSYVGNPYQVAVLTAQNTSTSCGGSTRAYRSGWMQTGGSRYDQPAPGYSEDPSWEGTYGTVEVKFKIDAPNAPAGGPRGIWPAVWLLAADGGNYPARPEIDILEQTGTANECSANVHFTGVDQQVASYACDTDDGNFHTVKLVWTAGDLTFYYDGVQKGNYSVDGPIPDVPMYLILNLAVCPTGQAFCTNPVASDYPVSMIIDKVTITQ